MEIDEICTAQSGNQGREGWALPPGTWRCLVCQKPCKNMNVLPCDHKFCQECLRLWAGIYIDMYRGTHGEFPCQICWKQFAVPIQGLEAYEQDYQLRVLQENMQKMSMGQGQNVPSQVPTTWQSQSGPFGYTPKVPQETSIMTQNQGGSEIQMNSFMGMPWGPNPGPNCDTGPSGFNAQMDSDASQCASNSNCNPAQVNSLEGSTGVNNPEHSLEGTICYPSMVSHMAQQPMSPDCGELGTPSYCRRSYPMYMHMI